LNAREIDVGYFHLESLLTLVQPDHYGLLSDAYTGPGDVTQHYFYAGIALVPLAVLGARSLRLLRSAAFLGVPFLWYALGPDGGLFRLLVRLPGFRSVELPMHGWFLPSLGLALLGGAGLLRLRPCWRAPLLGFVWLDVLFFNQLQLPLAFARDTFAELYGAPLAAFAESVAAARPPVERVYGLPLTAVGYRNHGLQSRVETTYGYNPLELAGYAAYEAAAADQPGLVRAFGASHTLVDGSLEPISDALPRAYFAQHVLAVTDDSAASAALLTLDPAHDSVIVGPLPEIAEADPRATATISEGGLDRLTIHYRSATQGLLRVAVAAYPGWHAALNGRELPLLTVDRAFLGVITPSGEGDLQLWYAPRLFLPGLVISLLALVVALVALFAKRPAERSEPL
jgi:hypothetical protein